jgi:polysaccharide deacetylase family protein (PEP-CTERM system associated)
MNAVATPARVAGSVTHTLIPQAVPFDAARPVNAMSVDVEDYFQVWAFEDQIDRRDWSSLECRVPANMERILAMFERHDVRATFFILGWVAERYPDLVRRMAALGHEIASHGHDHRRVFDLSPGQFREDVSRTRDLLEQLAGREVTGYRAPSYSIDERNLWALDVLQECGYRYSSSIYPVAHDIYGMPDAPRFAFRTRPGGLLELPVTTVELGSFRLPAGGGGYFRLWPYQLSRWMIRRINRNDRQPAIFYFHPWEVDPGQPRVSNARLKSRVRHYLNLSQVESRLDRLLADFRWAPVRSVFDAV